ncbi:MAG: 2-amino-4-hydroxy-6-hydroxymethyldihydropteridine diphosphokinase [Deltaproteobacteria bacterium]|nr:2-amino-4-hydroxy-6-hydroxymethyldihydropteridine diphosphokinase [Deltaproteobacteria bacterium]
MCNNHTVFISVGSNYVYKTEPVDYKDQDWFINFVIQIGTSLDPFALLNRIGDIQGAAGRDRDPVRFGPRILDMDIIFFDDLLIDTGNLVIPHPRMHERRFVLQPLCDIDPNLIHPVLKKRMEDLLENLNDDNQEIIRLDDQIINITFHRLSGIPCR